MPAAPDMRDGLIAAEISKAEDAVAELVHELGRLVEHATAHDAIAHVEFYEHVQGCLASAEKQLGRAYAVMLNGEPEDYAP